MPGLRGGGGAGGTPRRGVVEGSSTGRDSEAGGGGGGGGLVERLGLGSRPFVAGALACCFVCSSRKKSTMNSWFSLMKSSLRPCSLR